MASFDYLAIAYQYGINSDSKAKKLFQDAMNITRKLVGNNVPQNTLEREFPKELMDNYQDLLQSETSGKANKRRESVKESMDTQLLEEYLSDKISIEDLVKKL